MRFDLPEPGLSRAAWWCLLLDGTLLVLLLLSMWPNRWEQWHPPVDLPVARVLQGGPHHEVDRLALTVTRDGRVWRAYDAPLDAGDLAEWLDERVLAYDAEQRAAGDRGFEDIGGGRRVSRLGVLLRIDRAAPWGSVHDLLRQVGEASLYRAVFLVAHEPHGQFKMQAFLPTAALDCVYIAARVRAASVTVDGREVPDLTAAIRAAYAPLRDGEKAVSGLIDADPGVPFGDVVRVLDAFVDAGIAKVDLAAGSIRAAAVPR